MSLIKGKIKMTKTYPAWIYPNRPSQVRHLRRYKNLDYDDIQDECELFYDCMVRNGPLKAQSTTFGTYFRGWLARANHQKGEK